MNLDITVTIPDPIQWIVGCSVAITIVSMCAILILRAYAHPHNRAVCRVFQRDIQALINRLLVAPDIQPTTYNREPVSKRLDNGCIV